MINYKISIITPSFNQSIFLERTILSILNQDYSNYEYIIVDGGSTDKSLEIIRKYQKHLTFWVSEKDNGQSDALNKGFIKASGDILAYVNSDDLLLPGTLKKINYLFNRYKDVDFIYGHALIINEDDNVINFAIALPFKFKEHFNGVFAIPQPSCFWRRKVFEIVEDFNVNNYSSMDAEFFITALKRGSKFKFCNNVFSAFRTHHNSKTGNISNGFIEKAANEMKSYSIKVNYNMANKHFYLKLFYKIKYIPNKYIFKILLFTKYFVNKKLNNIRTINSENMSSYFFN